MVAPTGGKGQHASTWSVLRKRLAPLPQVMATSGKEEEEYGLKVSALRFLSDCNHLENIERQCTSLLTTSASEGDPQQTTVYKITLVIDTLCLLEASAPLGNLLLHMPSNGWRIFHDVVFLIIKELQWLPSSSLMSQNQLLLLVRLSSLPSFPPYHVSHVSQLPCLGGGEGGFVCCTGVICSISNVEKYSESACFHCPDSSCAADHYIRCHSVGSSEYITTRGNLTCRYCGLTLVEDVKQRTLSDKLVISLIPVDRLLPLTNGRHQGFTIVLRDDLCSLIEIGGEYTVIGVAVHDTKLINGRIIVNTVIEANNVYQSVTDSICTGLPTNIRDIYNACQYSSWSFPATLAYSFGAEVVPPGLYHKLKLILLLSLVASREPRDKMIDILIIGSSETDSITKRLMYYASDTLSKRSVVHTLTGGGGGGGLLSGSVRRDDGLEWIDAGSLLLSKGGLCLINNINNMKKDEKESLQHVLETGYITVQSNKKSSSVTSITVPLRCSLWMSCDYHVTGYDSSSSIKPLHEMNGMGKALMDHSGLVLLTDSPNMGIENYIDVIMSNHLLNKAMKTSPTWTHPLISSDDINKILSFCSSLTVTLLPSAHQLLTSYYVASRRLRGSDTPLTALNTMISLSLAHAQLNMKTEATLDDALMAILLYEESLIYRYGHSVLYIQPLLHLREEESVSSLIGKDFDDYMYGFYEQLKSFISNHSQLDSYQQLQREE